MAHGGQRFNEALVTPAQTRPTVLFVNVCHNHRISRGENDPHSPQMQGSSLQDMRRITAHSPHRQAYAASRPTLPAWSVMDTPMAARGFPARSRNRAKPVALVQTMLLPSASHLAGSR